MKRMLPLLLSLSLLLSLLAACQSPAVETSTPSAEPSSSASAQAEIELSCTQILGGVRASMEDELKAATVYSTEKKDHLVQLAPYVQGAYGLDEDQWEDACIARLGGASAVELAVIRFIGEDAAKAGEDRLRDYLHRREGDFTGYAPAQAKLVAEAEVCRQGLYVGLFICEDSGLAARTFAEIVESGEAPEPTPTPKPGEDLEAVLDMMLARCKASGEDVSDLDRIDDSDPDRLNSILRDDYKMGDVDLDGAVILRGRDGSVFELAVLRGIAELDAAPYLRGLGGYLDTKEEEYARFPAQAQMLNEGWVMNPLGSNVIVIIVCADPEAVVNATMDFFGGRGFSTVERHADPDAAPAPDVVYDPNYPDRVLFAPPNEEDMSVYDTSAIRAAWEAGDPAGLSQEDRMVYGAAEEILAEILRDGMTDFEKEEAIYRWIVDKVSYDWTHMDGMEETPRTAYQPYGALVDRAAVCLGYSTGLQLLMELAGVECTTVVGACYNSEADHAWNMVRLNEEWYCLDATWDATGRRQMGEEYEWKYFNLTSDEFVRKDHQWDYANTPEATAEDQGRNG